MDNQQFPKLSAAVFKPFSAQVACKCCIFNNFNMTRVEVVEQSIDTGVAKFYASMLKENHFAFLEHQSIFYIKEDKIWSKILKKTLIALFCSLNE